MELRKTERLVAAIKECGSDVDKIFTLVKRSYNAGYTRGKNDTLNNIFSYHPEG